MITIQIDEEVANMVELEYMLEEVLRRVQKGSWKSYEPDYTITGEEEETEE